MKHWIDVLKANQDLLLDISKNMAAQSALTANQKYRLNRIYQDSAKMISDYERQCKIADEVLGEMRDTKGN